MKLNYKILILIFLLTTLPLSAKLYEASSLRGLKGYEEQKIDASRNARLHSNMGNLYFEQKNYIAAIKEYEIAYNLDYKSSNASVYLYNIARSYMAVNSYALAKNAIEGAIHLDCINMTYYNTLVDCYIKLGIEKAQLLEHLKDDTNPYNRIVAGLIFIKTGNKTDAKILFDDFINKNPDMIITEDIKFLIKNL